MNKENNLIEFFSSWGCLHVDEKGIVKKVEGVKEYEGEKNYLYDIARVDLAELKTFLKSKGQTLEDEEDILSVGTWNHKGDYEEAQKDWREEHYFDLTKKS